MTHVPDGEVPAATRSTAIRRAPRRVMLRRKTLGAPLCGGGRERGGRERGAGSILAIAVIATMMSASALLIPLSAAVSLRHRAAGAADAAALAAADAASGWSAGPPCAEAGRLAAENRAALARCEIDGLVVTVEVEIATGFGVIAGWDTPLAVIRQTASAGPWPGTD